MRRTRVPTLLALAALTLLVFLMLDAFVRKATYPVPLVRVPESPPVPIEALTLETSAGDRVVAWASPRDGAAAGRPAGVFLHGNGDNLETLRRAGLFQRLDGLEIPWLALDYPGYGRSGGTPGEAALVASGEAALEAARRRWPGRPVVLAGWSLGAGVAVQTALRHPQRVDGLVLLSSFTRLADVAAVHFPAFVARPLVGDRYDSLTAAPRLPHPALVLHGARDRIIPSAQGERLAAALGGPTCWVPVPGAGHNDLLGHEVVWREMERFLDERAAR